MAVIASTWSLDYLDMPPKRLAVPDVPIPYSNTLEDFVIPGAESIARAVKEVMG